MITKAINNCFITAKLRNWKKVYFAFDIHGTILHPNYDKDNIANTFYPGSIEVLKSINRPDISTILYTCSHPIEIKKYEILFKNNGLEFNFINENKDVINGGYGCYDKKPYFSVLFEDKAGFDPLTDWILVKEEMKKFPESFLKTL